MKIIECPHFLMTCGKTERISQKRIDAIRKIKMENPGANQKWIAVMCFESEYAVGVALKERVETNFPSHTKQ